MVTVREANAYSVRQIFQNHIFRLWLKIKDTKGIHLSISRREATTYLIYTLLEAGLDVKAVSEAVGVKQSMVEYVRDSGFTPSRGFKNAIKLINNPLALFKMSDSYAFNHYVYPSMLRTLLIEDLFHAGWTPLKISKSMGFNIRTTQRIIKKLKEDND